MLCMPRWLTRTLRFAVLRCVQVKVADVSGDSYVQVFNDQVRPPTCLYV